MATPEERIARALCRKEGLPENTKFEGQPMWRSFLGEAQAALDAADIGPLLDVLKTVANDASVSQTLRNTARKAMARYDGV